MEQLIGLLIFAAFAAVSHFISRAQEKAKEEERKRQPPTLTRDDIPPDLRRQLYGDTENVPVARPRSEAPPRRVPPPMSQPRRADVAPAPRRAAPEEGRDFDSMPSLEEAAASLEEVAAAPPPRAVPPAPPQRRPQPPQRRPAAQQRPQPRPQQAPQQQRAPQAAPQPVAAIASAPPAAQAPGALAPSYSARQLFATRADLRRAILTQEIIGPPRALREYEPV